VPGPNDSIDPNLYPGVDPRFVSAVLGCVIPKTGVTFADVAGMEDAKRLLHDALILPAIAPKFFVGINKPWSGILLYGPPGTGKTQLAKAAATEANVTFINVTPSLVDNSLVGESEKMVKAIFTVARAHAPSCIFIDEIDALLGRREGGEQKEYSTKVKTEFLTQMQGIQTDNQATRQPEKTEDGEEPTPSSQIVMVLGATNLPWKLDEAVVRRLEKRIFVPLPDYEARLQLLRILLKETNLEPNIDFEEIARKMEGYSGSDITTVLKGAVMASVRRMIDGKTNEEVALMVQDPNYADLAVCTMDDICTALKKTQPSVHPEDITRHVEWEKKCGSV